MWNPQVRSFRNLGGLTIYSRPHVIRERQPPDGCRQPVHIPNLVPPECGAILIQEERRRKYQLRKNQNDFIFFFANVWLENWIPRNYTIHSNGSDPVCARPIISPDRFHMTCSCLDCRSRSKNVCSRILLFQGYISVMGIRGMQPALLGFGLPRVGHVWHCILPWTLCSAVIVCWWLWLYSPCIRLYLIAHARSFPPAQLPS